MGYLDSYQFSNKKFKFRLNVLLQICIFLKVIYMYKYLER